MERARDGDDRRASRADSGDRLCRVWRAALLLGFDGATVGVVLGGGDDRGGALGAFRQG